METEQIRQLQLAVKCDDKRAFEELVNSSRELFGVCFDFIPLLSACYLLQATAILRAYERTMCATREYTVVDEFPEAYTAFRRVSGRAIRLYVGTGRVLYPAEALAVIGDRYTLRRLYTVLRPDEKSRGVIADVFRLRHAERIAQQNGRITMKRSRLSSLQKISVSVIALVCVLSIVFFGVISSVAEGKFGGAILYVTNGQQLQKAMSANAQSVELHEDVNVSEGVAIFGGAVDGGGKTLTVSGENGAWVESFEGTLRNAVVDLRSGMRFATTNAGSIENVTFLVSSLSSSVIDENNGTITGCTFLAQDVEYSVTADGGAFIGTNRGNISDSTVTLSGNITESVDTADDSTSDASAKKAVYYSFFVYTNRGNIISTSLKENVTITGDGEGDAYFSGVVVDNYGTMKSITLSEGSVIDTDTVDFSGMCVTNKYENSTSGQIVDCTNYADISQLTAQSTWSPNVSGIVWHNYGELHTTANYGNLYSATTATESTVAIYLGGVYVKNSGAVYSVYNNGAITAEALSSGTQTYIYVGGVGCVNYNYMEKSKNGGTVTGISESDNKAQVYAGGVLASNNTYYTNANATIFNCASSGKIITAVNAADGNNSFCGGITAYSNGMLVNSYATCTFENRGGSNIRGGVVGYVNFDAMVQMFWSSYYNNNYYYSEEAQIFGVGSIPNSDYVSGTDISFAHITDLAELLAWEYYIG